MTAISSVYTLPFREAVLALARDGENGCMTVRQHAVLIYLKDTENEKKRTIRAIAEALKLGKPAITRAVDSLTMLGYVQRRRNPKDGRDVFVDPTEKGSAQVPPARTL